MFFNDWFSLARVAVVGMLAYTALILMLRTSGKRALSKMNAFDLIVTIALGSVLATVLLTKDVALAEGVVAFALLLSLQYLLTWSSVRWKFIESIVKAEPTLLYFEGHFLEKAMLDQRVTKADIYAAVRSQGMPGLYEISAAVQESDGSISVLKKTKGKPLPILHDVKHRES